MTDEKYPEKFEQWQKDYVAIYKQYMSFQNNIYQKIENILIIPIVGITAYIFQSLCNDIGIVYFCAILLVSAAPLIANLIGLVCMNHYTSQVLNHMYKQLQTIEPLSEPLIMKQYFKKLRIINNWGWFSIFLSLLSMVMAIMIKFQYVQQVIRFAETLLLHYFVALLLFLWVIKENPIKFLCNNYQ